MKKEKNQKKEKKEKKEEEDKKRPNTRRRERLSVEVYPGLGRCCSVRSTEGLRGSLGSEQRK